MVQRVQCRRVLQGARLFDTKPLLAVANLIQGDRYEPELGFRMKGAGNKKTGPCGPVLIEELGFYSASKAISSTGTVTAEVTLARRTALKGCMAIDWEPVPETAV